MRNLLKPLLPNTPSPRIVPFGLARGCRAHIDFRYDTGFYFGRHERELFRHYRALIGAGDRCFDIGGYRGWDAIIFAKLSDGGPVVTCESNCSNIAQLQKSIDASGFDIQVINRYVTDRESEETVTIDQMSSDQFVPDFIKMDIEGHEAIALAGAKETLRQHKPSLVVEVHGEAVERECKEILTEADYQPVTVSRSSYWGKETRGMVANRWLVCQGLR